jgi:hypothetical protein
MSTYVEPFDRPRLVGALADEGQNGASRTRTGDLLGAMHLQRLLPTGARSPRRSTARFSA